MLGVNGCHFVAEYSSNKSQSLEGTGIGQTVWALECSELSLDLHHDVNLNWRVDGG